MTNTNYKKPEVLSHQPIRFETRPSGQHDKGNHADNGGKGNRGNRGNRGGRGNHHGHFKF